MQSPGLKSEKEFTQEAVKQNIPTKLAESIYFYQDRARKAYEQRESANEFFDGMGYYQDYILNRQAMNSYLRPKKNDDEVRVNTGVAEKKIETVWNELKQISLDIECRAFDKKDLPLVNLGESFTDAIKRTNEIEREDDMYDSAVWELLSQRAVFIEECVDNGTVRDKREDGKTVKRVTGMPYKKLLSGLKVFLGDITLPWYKFNQQPYVIVYERIHWKEAERRYRYDENGKENPMWKFVGKGNSVAFGGLFGLRFGIIEEDEVEVLAYRSYPDDEKMDLVNGVPMDKVGTKLPWEYEGYNIRMFTLKPMSLDFAYGKPLTASSKTLQSLNNETIRLLIRKFRQAIEPPSGTSGRVFSRDIWAPAAMTQGIKKDDISVLIDHQGVTSSEMSMYDLIEKKTEEFIGAGSLQQGIKQSGQQTATEIQQLQKQFATQLGSAIYAIMVMRRDMSYLRLYHLLEMVKKPTGKVFDTMSEKMKNTYMMFTKEDADLGNGRLGRKQIIFQDEDLPPEALQAVYDKEEELSVLGQDTRFFFINVKKLLEVPLNWFIVVNQGFKESESLDKVLFTDSLNQAVAVSQVAQRPLNGDSIIQDFGQIWKRKDWFQKEAPQSLVPMGAGMDQGAGTDAAGQMTPDRPQVPSINTLEGNLT